jgi:hypothetical protein
MEEDSGRVVDKAVVLRLEEQHKARIAGRLWNLETARKRIFPLSAQKKSSLLTL